MELDIRNMNSERSIFKTLLGLIQPLHSMPKNEIRRKKLVLMQPIQTSVVFLNVSVFRLFTSKLFIVRKSSSVEEEADTVAFINVLS